MSFNAYKPKSHGGGSSSSNTNNHDMAKIFVGGLSWQTTEETLRYHFEQYGEVVSVEVMRDRNTGDPRGFAFVVFKDDTTVDLVMSNLPHEINHKVVDVKRAQARGMAPPSIHKDGMEGDVPNNQRGGDNGGGGGGGGNHGGGHYMKQENNHDSSSTKDLSPEQLQNKIFVGGLPLHLSRDGLREFFSQFGTVVDAIIMMDAAQSRSRGFGFVTFENGSGGAQTALKSQPIYIDKKYVEIKLATPKGDQQNPHGGGNKSSKYQNHATGLRNAEAASMAYQSKGEFAGLAASFGRNGWRAGYGTIAFGSSGWNVKGWENISKAPEHSGFSFSLIENTKQRKDSSRKKRGGSMNSLENNKGVKRQRQS